MAGEVQRLLLTHSTCWFEITLSNHLTCFSSKGRAAPLCPPSRVHLSDRGHVQDHLVTRTRGPAGQREEALEVKTAHALKGPQRRPWVPVLTWKAIG